MPDTRLLRHVTNRAAAGSRKLCKAGWHAQEILLSLGTNEERRPLSSPVLFLVVRPLQPRSEFYTREGRHTCRVEAALLRWTEPVELLPCSALGHTGEGGWTNAPTLSTQRSSSLQ